MRYLVLSLLLSGAAFPQEAEIRAAEKKWAAAIVAKDGATLEKLLGDGLIYAHSTGVVDSKKSYIAKVTSGKQRYEGAEYKDETVKLYGTTAVGHGHMRMWGVNQNGKFDDLVMVLHVWVKTAGGWQLAAHQTTKLK
jgi:ketosteroid isomerase-like protein